MFELFTSRISPFMVLYKCSICRFFECRWTERAIRWPLVKCDGYFLPLKIKMIVAAQGTVKEQNDCKIVFYVHRILKQIRPITHRWRYSLPAGPDVCLCVSSSNGDDDLSPQTISLLVYISGALGKNGPFLVISPLSVMENWREELERCRHTHAFCTQTACMTLLNVRCACLQLRPLSDRAVLQRRQAETGWASEEDGHTELRCCAHHVRGQRLTWEQNDPKFLLSGLWRVLFSRPQLCLKDASFLRRWVCSQVDLCWRWDQLVRNDVVGLTRWRWNVLVVDEAHRLKNQDSLLHRTLTQVPSRTGGWGVPASWSALRLPSVPVTCAVLGWLQRAADGDAHPEQPAGALRLAELHSAQRLRSWWRPKLRQLLLQRTTPGRSRYDAHLACQSDMLPLEAVTVLEHIIWDVFDVWILTSVLGTQLLSCRVSWSPSCFVGSNRRWPGICRRRWSWWCTTACRLFRRNTTKPSWWKTQVRVQPDPRWNHQTGRFLQ